MSSNEEARRDNTRKPGILVNEVMTVAVMGVSCVMEERLKQHVERYGASHRTRGNRLLHFVGIPFLLIGSLGLLSRLTLPIHVPGIRLDLAWVALLVAISWSLWLGGRNGLLSAAIYAGGYLLGTTLSLACLGWMTVMGVVAHLVGHYGIEHRPPALFSHPVALLEAIPWLLTMATSGLGVRRGRNA